MIPCVATYSTHPRVGTVVLCSPGPLCLGLSCGMCVMLQGHHQELDDRAAWDGLSPQAVTLIPIV